MREFACSLHNNVLSQKLVEEHGNLLPRAYFEAPAMLEMAIAVAENSHSRIMIMPFDYMAEAEAMGANLAGKDDHYGLRAAAAKYNSIKELLELPPFDFNSGRLAVIMEAFSLAIDKGYDSCLNLSGFLTVIEMLLSMPRLFSEWRKYEDELFNFAGFYKDQLIRYSTLVAEKGCKIYSYSDPVAMISVIGENKAASLFNNFLIPFLEELSATQGGGVIHLCGRTSFALEDLGLATIEEIKLADKTGYQDAVIELSNRAKDKILIGHGCLNSNKKISKLTKIVLKGAK